MRAIESLVQAGRKRSTVLRVTSGEDSSGSSLYPDGRTLTISAQDNLLQLLFGPGEGSPSERALRSARRFVRDQDHLAPYKDGATGRVFTAVQALDIFGAQLLIEAVETGAAVLPTEPNEPASTLAARRDQLQLSERVLARRAGVREVDIRNGEDPRASNPIRVLERIARALGLDERRITLAPGAGADEDLGVRLRTLRRSRSRSAPPTTVSGLSEAAWVIRRQAELCNLLEERSATRAEFQPSENYGDKDYPAWLHGYWLATRTRELLGLSKEEPIECLRQLVESLGIPVVQTTLPASFAGATVRNLGTRGIVLNTVGDNSNVWVRRATLAHELGHLLWDPDQKLRTLRVDEYRRLEDAPWSVRDPVEARANAFAIELLAPSGVVADYVAHIGDEIDVRPVMERFGISATAARYHVWNATGRGHYTFSSIRASDSAPTEEWRARESFTVDYFPLSDTPESRRGRFAAVTARAAERGLITEDSAGAYLTASVESFRKVQEDLRSFDDVEVR